jgi:hypothetical protein
MKVLIMKQRLQNISMINTSLMSDDLNDTDLYEGFDEDCNRIV